MPIAHPCPRASLIDGQPASVYRPLTLGPWFNGCTSFQAREFRGVPSLNFLLLSKTSPLFSAMSVPFSIRGCVICAFAANQKVKEEMDPGARDALNTLRTLRNHLNGIPQVS